MRSTIITFLCLLSTTFQLATLIFSCFYLIWHIYFTDNSFVSKFYVKVTKPMRHPFWTSTPHMRHVRPLFYPPKSGRATSLLSSLSRSQRATGHRSLASCQTPAATTALSLSYCIAIGCVNFRRPVKS